MSNLFCFVLFIQKLKHVQYPGMDIYGFGVRISRRKISLSVKYCVGIYTLNEIYIILDCRFVGRIQCLKRFADSWSKSRGLWKFYVQRKMRTYNTDISLYEYE